MRRLRAIAISLAIAAAGVVAVNPPAASAESTVTSNNWAGYVASGTSFSTVSGGWTVPRAKSSTQGYSAMWVGLGGASDAARELEQVGTDSDFVNGHANYDAWYELVPKAPVKLHLHVSPGDRVSAQVSVTGTQVTVQLADLTTGKAVTKTLRMSSPDTSSAEWIAEAPTVVTARGADVVVPLADFGRATFTGATATAGGHTGTIADPAWSAVKVDMAASAPALGRHTISELVTREATTSSLRNGGSAFHVTAVT